MQLGVGGSNIPSSLLLETKKLIFNTASNWVESKIDHLKHKEEWPKETIFYRRTIKPKLGKLRNKGLKWNNGLEKEKKKKKRREKKKISNVNPASKLNWKIKTVFLSYFLCETLRLPLDIWIWLPSLIACIKC